MAPVRIAPSTRPRGFTLVELLVVIGVMAVVATLIGVGLSRGTEGTSLAAAQNMIMSQLAATRAQAALHGDRAALVVVDDATALEGQYRVLGVAVEEEGVWRLVSDPIRLPGAVGVVDLQSDNSLWQTAMSVEIEWGGPPVNCRAIEIAANGSLGVAGGGEIWLSLGQGSATGWRASIDAPRRGVRVSRYGAIEPIAEGGVVE